MKTLSCLLWTPLAGALVLAFLPRHWHRYACSIALGFSGLCLLLTLFVTIRFETNSPDVQFSEMLPWNPGMGSFYALGVDGFSLPLVLLSAFLCLVALLAGLGSPRPRGYYIAFLSLEFGMLGVFLSRDWALFYVFWELTLIPLFFLIDQWGGKRRHGAALNFVLYTMGGSVFMLIALLMVYAASAEHSTLMDSMQGVARGLPRGSQVLIFLGLLTGFGVKMPVFPLHGWLPLAHVEAPSPISILLSGALLKMGAYGLIRACAMLPEAVVVMQPWLAAIALVGIVYGALLAWRQSDLKAMIAYSSVSHMGFVLVGLAAMNPVGLTGAVMQMTAHGLVAGALFLLIGLLYERTHTRELADYGALGRTAPRLAAFTVLALLASMGLPGSVGFVAELHAMLGGFQHFGAWMLVASFGVLVGGAYALRCVAALVAGPAKPAMSGLEDLRPAEFAGASCLVAAIVWLGLAPAALLELSRVSIGHYLAALQPEFL
ncbi:MULTISPECIES: complex I subunit 4 family protein [unclassified Methylococcus]|uniref:complex I subunit 4 family protein n=1 Tax=unclassified Methylococcus TaxID=2618889 RepID=UPI003D7D400A